MQKRVTTIPATVDRFSKIPFNTLRKRRTAGYARVSTDSEEQETSYDAQVDYYTKYIKRNPEWEFVKVYTDDGITATNTKRRSGFKDMVEDALNGKIDLIITKSVSRFARNTVDSLETVRKLKEAGVEIYFEKENIWTLDSKGELLITIMSSLAQEESRSISENTTWGKRKSFSDGNVSMSFKYFLGYEKDEAGNIQIIPEEAELVKNIYKMFLEGLSPYGIANKLTELGIKTPKGKDKWQQSTIKSILTNEKYKGDALLQKEYTVDFLTKKRRKNHGEVPQYYVEGNHEAIIEPVVWDTVQEEMRRRTETKTCYSGVTMFSSRIKCSECGSWFGAKVWHSNSKYRKVIYRCNHKFQNEQKCNTPHLTEDEIKDAFVKAVNELLVDRDELIENVQIMKDAICNTKEDQDKQSELITKMMTIAELIKKAVKENSSIAQDQVEYQRHYNNLVAEYEVVKGEYEQITEIIEMKRGKRKVFKQFIKALEDAKTICEEFDPYLWSSLLDHVEVYTKEDIRFVFRNELEIKIAA